MNHRQKTQSMIHLVSALALAGVTITGASGCEASATADEPALDAETSALIEDLRVRTQTLEDLEAIRSVAACYGRGHDEIFHHLQGDQGPSLAILRGCFTDDVASEVFFFADETPAAQLSSLAELVGFIEQFAVDTATRAPATSSAMSASS